METAKTAKPHVAETLLSVIIQNRLADVSAISLLSAVLRTVPLKVVDYMPNVIVLIVLPAVGCQSLPPKYRPTPTVFQGLRCGSSENTSAESDHSCVTCPVQSPPGEHVSSNARTTVGSYLPRYSLDSRPKAPLHLSIIRERTESLGRFSAGPMVCDTGGSFVKYPRSRPESGCHSGSPNMPPLSEMEMSCGPNALHGKPARRTIIRSCVLGFDLCSGHGRKDPRECFRLDRAVQDEYCQPFNTRNVCQGPAAASGH